MPTPRPILLLSDNVGLAVEEAESEVEAEVSVGLGSVAELSLGVCTGVDAPEEDVAWAAAVLLFAARVKILSRRQQLRWPTFQRSEQQNVVAASSQAQS